MAAAVVGALVLTLGGANLPTRTGRPGSDAAHPLTASPDQHWGSAVEASGATGAARIAGKVTPNRTLPQTVRGKYPLVSLPQDPPAPEPNTASVVEAPFVPAKGFDEETSREAPAGRDAYQRSYDNADGSQTTEYSTTPVHYRTADGNWAPIDTTLSPAAGGGWRNAADTVDIRLAARADATELVSMSSGGGHLMSYGLVGANAAAGQASGSTVTYPGVLSQVDLRLEARAGEVKETLILNSAAAQNRFVFPLRLTGLTASIVDGQVVLADSAGTRRAVIPAGSMQDAGNASSTAVAYKLITVDAKPALELTADTRWLTDPARRYPVQVDPTVSLPVAGGAASSSMYVQGSGSASGANELRVGTIDGSAAASYVKFDSLMSSLQNHTIFGVALQVANYDSDSCKSRQVTVHPVTAAWTAGSGSSYPGPAFGASIGSKSFAHGYIATGQSASACPAAAELIDLGAGGQRLVQRWVNGEQANYGLSLRASGSDALSGKRLAGSSTANPPKLFVTHSPYNATYSIPSPVPVPPVLQNQSGKVKVTVTNLSAEAWAPANYYLAYRAYNAVTGAAVTQQRAASLTASVARGAKVTLDATINALPPGKYFLDFTMVRTGGVVFTDHQVAPARIVLQVFDIAPVVQELYPPNGYRAPTLTPQLWARALDIDAPPNSALQYKFELCDVSATGSPVSCTNSGYLTKTAWTVPAGRLVWSKAYQWRVFVKDASNEVTSPYATVLAEVPQPEVTSRIGGSRYASRDQDFDPQVGNVSAAAVDAPVVTVGPQLSVARTYNSLDPRQDTLFGAGWVTQYDMRVVPDDDGSGNVVVTYPDGQQVRFGRNLDGTYAAPSGRVATLTLTSGTWRLSDPSGTTYEFSGTRPTKITDASGRSIVFSYNTTDGTLAKAQVSNSQTNTAGRALFFTVTGGHVASVRTDPVGGAALTWTYAYTGDQLTQVCAPGQVCTKYEYATGSHYRTAVLDALPESFWRLGEGEGLGAGSEVAVNVGKDAGSYHTVTLGTAGAISGTSGTAVTFNGSTSYVELPKGTLKKSRDAAVELWFATTTTGTGGPLLGYQDKAVGTASTAGAPVLYIGTDGKVRGQFATGTIAPITSAGTVNDGRWHHLVLSVMGTTQTMYLDGVKVGDLAGQTVEHSLLTFNQIGAAYAAAPASWPAWGSASQRYFAGAIDEVGLYSHPLGPVQVAAHRGYGLTAAGLLTKVTLPSGKVAVESTYDIGVDRVKEYTDREGGTWKIGAPTVYGGNTDLRRSVQVLDPAGRPSLYEYDAIAGRVLRTGTPLGLETRTEDRPGEPTTPAPPPVETCSQPDPADPGFCTIVPSSAGGPVFVSYPLEGMAIRTFSYDDQGYQNVVTNEVGDTVTMTNDSRGNVTSRRTCRTASQCFTAYYTYPATATNPMDPRNDLTTETRDARSSGATDNVYRTTYTYTTTGQLASQTNPDGSQVLMQYTNGAEAAVGGNPPTGLIATSTDARGKITRYSYYHNGDVYRVTEPSGLITEFTYDALGRPATEKEISDTYPAGVTTTFTYDALSRRTVTTGPSTTDAVTGVRHQQSVVTDYDTDSNAVTMTAKDLLGGDPARIAVTEYDEYNRAVRTVDPEGNEVSFGWDRFGNQTSKVDENGNRYDFAYTARNMLAEVRLRNWSSDPAGAPATGTGDYLVLHAYSYDSAGRLASDTDAMGRRLEYQYYHDDLLNKLVLKGFHDANGTTRDYVVEENTYDGAGNLTQQVGGNGSQVTKNIVNPSGTVKSTVVDPDGLARTDSFEYDGNGNVTKTTRTGKPSNVPWAVANDAEVVSYIFDDAGNTTRETVTAGSVTRATAYQYDRRGLLTKTTDPRGTVAGANAAAYTTSYGYDELGRLLTVTGPAVQAENGGQAAQTVTPTQTFGYGTFGDQVAVRDELGNIGRTEYDKLGRVVRQIAPAYTPPGQTQAITSTVRYTYDAAGNVVQRIDPRGNTARYGYDQLDRMVTSDLPSLTDTERAVWKRTYTRTGEVLSTTDPTGARTESTYDDLDRPVTATQAERRPVADNYTARYTYDDAGNPIRIVAPNGGITVNTYDKADALITTVDPAGVTTQFGYDLAGRQVRQSDGLGRTARVSFDLFGQVSAEADLKSTGEILRNQTYAYDLAGNLITSTDPNTVATTYTYDAANRLVRQVEPVTATSSITTSFGYDAAGHQTRYTDGRGNQSVYTYNVLGLPESVVEPATTAQPAAADRTWTVAYDADGNGLRLSAPGGVVRQRTFDAAGRLTGETGVGAASATTDRTLGYDLAGRPIRASAQGGTDTFTYNDRGQLLTTAGPSGTASYGYDPDGNMTSRTDVAGTASYTYTQGRLKTQTDGITGTTQTLAYNNAGQVSTVAYGAGRVRTYTYDDIGRLATDTLRNLANQTVSSIGYGFDLNDHVQTKTTTGTAGAGNNTYSYDLAGRLKSWTAAAGTTDYTWDASGNRTKAGAKTSTFDERNRLLSDGDRTYTYTARGTLATRTTTSTGTAEQFSFDAFDRLVSAGASSYTYDGLDRVAARNGTAITYADLADDPVSDGAEQYARGPDGDILAVARGAQERLALTDAHGDVVAGFDPAASTLTTLSDSTAYDPFGAVTAAAGDTGDLGYQGDFTDPQTGQVDMGARWYTPATGTFASRDSLGYTSGDSILANRYTYGAGAPLDFADPDGHLPDWVHKGWNKVKSAGSKVYNAGKSAVSSLWSGAKTGYRYAMSGLRWAAQSLSSAGRWLISKGRSALSNARKYIGKGLSWIAGKAGAFGRSIAGAARAAREKAAEIRRAAIARAKAITKRARDAVATAVRNVVLPKLKDAGRAIIAGTKKIVSAVADLPAKVVSVSKNVVKDVAKATQAIYDKAVKEAGPVLTAVSAAVQAVIGFAQGDQDPVAQHDNVPPDAQNVRDAMYLIGDRMAQTRASKQLFNTCLDTVPDFTGRCERDAVAAGKFTYRNYVDVYCGSVGKLVCALPDPDYITLESGVGLGKGLGVGQSMTVTRTGQTYSAVGVSAGVSPPIPVSGAVVASWVYHGKQRATGPEVDSFLHGWAFSRRFASNGSTVGLDPDFRAWDAGTGTDFASVGVSYGRHTADLGADLWK